MRLDKYLRECGFGSRKEIKQLVKNGVVTKNGIAVFDEAMQIQEMHDQLAVDGEAVLYQKYVYLMLHKPAGYISANDDKRHATVFDLVPEYRHRDLFCVGRLDIDTEGLLLLCDDGPLAHRLLSPKHHVPKQYEVHLRDPISDEDLARLEAGIALADGEQCMPAKTWRYSSTQVKLEIYEGKFHQVKRMFHQVGNEVIYLKRVQMGTLVLDSSLAKGMYRQLTKQELMDLTGTGKDIQQHPFMI